ncbi:hypothetical protein BpHYR1_013247 [Brachionus plicatilis]|uniref:Uncharacterized protein n=1 Tax=Brachionus plicatilis TaxID=10195 RepID=A0A3M7S1A3_BRAPC|nr:hypothetical protein BpHYR1_013247 [Brachionus plicatilis]
MAKYSPTIEKDSKGQQRIFSYKNTLIVNNSLNPTKVTADFEKNSTNAMKAIFMCAVRIGLKKHCGKTEQNVFVNMFGALALVPIDKVQVVLEILKSVQPADAKCTQLLD